MILELLFCWDLKYWAKYLRTITGTIVPKRKYGIPRKRYVIRKDVDQIKGVSETRNKNDTDYPYAPYFMVSYGSVHQSKNGASMNSGYHH
jgi:hypothetical protein